MELAGGIPFTSDKDLKTQLHKVGVPPKTADAISLMAAVYSGPLRAPEATGW